MSKKKDGLNNKSKKLSFLLRHHPEVANLNMDEQGWVAVVEVISGTDITLDELRQIVEEDKKTRYSFNRDGDFIRANQGHTTSLVKMTFEERLPPPYLLHGTSKENYITIMGEGLKPMGRHHVHLTQDPATTRQVGSRHKGELVVFLINAGLMTLDGYKFFISENKVWLTDIVPPQYLSIVKN